MSLAFFEDRDGAGALMEFRKLSAKAPALAAVLVANLGAVVAGVRQPTLYHHDRATGQSLYLDTQHQGGHRGFSFFRFCAASRHPWLVLHMGPGQADRDAHLEALRRLILSSEA